MVPLDSAALKTYGFPFCPMTDEGVDLPTSLISLCQELSAMGSVAYVEAEFFGGAGTQACALFAGGKAGRVLVSPNAINEALKWLNVSAGEAVDEFEAVGLGRHRETESWH